MQLDSPFSRSNATNSSRETRQGARKRAHDKPVGDIFSGGQRSALQGILLNIYRPKSQQLRYISQLTAARSVPDCLVTAIILSDYITSRSATQLVTGRRSVESSRFIVFSLSQASDRGLSIKVADYGGLHSTARIARDNRPALTRLQQPEDSS